MIDIGLNLTHDSFAHDLDAVLARATAAGVTQMLVTGSDVAHSAAALALTRRFPAQLRATAGIHPHHAKDFQATDIPMLRELLGNAQVLAVGECGLDYFRNFSSHEQQERAWRSQLELAVDIGKPVFLHERDAHDAFCAILADYLPQLSGAVAHCFTGNAEQVRRYVQMGLHVGITGWICDERRGAALREAVRHIPLDRLLVETDAPYLIPRTLRPKHQLKSRAHRNEPMHLPAVVAELARCRNELPELIAAATTSNAQRLFSWV